MASHELLHIIYWKLQSHCSCMQQWRAQNFLVIYTENQCFAIEACSNDEHRASLWYMPKIAVLPIAVSRLFHAATASKELLYNICRKSQFHHWCMQQQRTESLLWYIPKLATSPWHMQKRRAQSFFITYIENHGLALNACNHQNSESAVWDVVFYVVILCVINSVKIHTPSSS